MSRPFWSKLHVVKVVTLKRARQSDRSVLGATCLFFFKIMTLLAHWDSIYEHFLHSPCLLHKHVNSSMAGMSALDSVCSKEPARQLS